jgi:hypothetical protein
MGFVISIHSYLHLLWARVLNVHACMCLGYDDKSFHAFLIDCVCVLESQSACSVINLADATTVCPFALQLQREFFEATLPIHTPPAWQQLILQLTQTRKEDRCSAQECLDVIRNIVGAPRSRHASKPAFCDDCWMVHILPSSSEPALCEAW